jgi:hypothetical protein
LAFFNPDDMFDSSLFPDIKTKKSLKPAIPVIKLAILDMYNGAPNMGMQNILDMLDLQVYPFTWDRFDVRGANQLPGMDYDIFISSGGPGDPREGDGIWDRNYFNLIDEIWEWNKFNKTKEIRPFHLSFLSDVLPALQIGRGDQTPFHFVWNSPDAQDQCRES